MYYVLTKTNEDWNEQPFGSRKQALAEVRNQKDQGNKVKLCIGKGRDRRLVLEYEQNKD